MTQRKVLFIQKDQHSQKSKVARNRAAHTWRIGQRLMTEVIAARTEAGKAQM